MKMPLAPVVPKDVVAIARWLATFYQSLLASFQSVHDYDVLYNEPDKLSIGMTRYFGAAVTATVITSEGLWVYTSTGWQKLN